MGLRELRIEGDPILRKKARPINKIDARIRKLLDDMVETMYADKGIGLAGPQVGILRRAIVVDVGQGPYKMVNPEIIEKSQETDEDVEGCLSVPAFNGTVIRPKQVRVKYLDENGEEQEVLANDLFARCLCHEIDHLDGILFRDKVVREINMKNPGEDDIRYLKEHGIIDDDDEGSEVKKEK